MSMLLVAALAAGSVFFFSWVGGRVVVRALAAFEERYVVRSWGDLGDLLLFIDARSVGVLGCCLAALAGGVGFAAGGWLLGGLLGMAGLSAPWLLVRAWRSRRIRLFERQLVDALQGLANALRAGLTFPQAVESLAREAPAPLGLELGLLVKEARLGVPLDQALSNLGARVASDDLSIVVVSANIARELGGNMAELFETIAGTVRERFRLEGRIAALTAQGRLQGWIVASLPLLLGLAMRTLRPDLVDPMLRHPFGQALIGAVVLLEAIGIFFIRKIVDIEV